MIIASVPEPSVSDEVLPAANSGLWYLVRGQNGCGYGGWGWQGSNGVPAIERTSPTCGPAS